MSCEVLQAVSPQRRRLSFFLCLLLRFHGADCVVWYFLPAVSLTKALVRRRQNNHSDVASCLLSYGADINAANADGTTPFHYACIFGATACLETVKRTGVSFRCAFSCVCYSLPAKCLSRRYVVHNSCCGTAAARRPSKTGPG